MPERLACAQATPRRRALRAPARPPRAGARAELLGARGLGHRGLRFYGNGPVNHAAIGLCIQNPRPSLALCQSPQTVAYPAVFARHRAIGDFRNFAITGTTPGQWLNQGCPTAPAYPREHCGLPLDLIAAREPTLISLTLGANPALIEIADPDRPANKCFHGARDDAEALACGVQLLDREQAGLRLAQVYRRLLLRPDGSVRSTHVAVMLYHQAIPLTLAVPATARSQGTAVKRARMALLIGELNRRIVAAVDQVRAELPPAERERLVALDPNTGAAGSFEAHHCLSDRPWVLVYDLCVHPSRAGHSVFADTLDRWAGPVLGRGGALSPNPIDEARFFTAQHYRDFLHREPDGPGHDFWAGLIEACSTRECVDAERAHVAHAFFEAAEFQGFFVDRAWRAAYGRSPALSEFLPDARSLAALPDAGATIDGRRAAYLDRFVARDAFRGRYDGATSGQYVDALLANSGAAPEPGERDALVSALDHGTRTRAGVLATVIDRPAFRAAERDPGFVLLAIYSYLRRDPAPGELDGWLARLRAGREEAMLDEFLRRPEYRARFGTP